MAAFTPPEFKMSQQIGQLGIKRIYFHGNWITAFAKRFNMITARRGIGQIWIRTTKQETVISLLLATLGEQFIISLFDLFVFHNFIYMIYCHDCDSHSTYFLGVPVGSFNP